MADEEVKKAKRVRKSVGPAMLFWLMVLKGLLSVDLALNDTDRTLVDALLTEFLFILGNHGLAAVYCQ